MTRRLPLIAAKAALATALNYLPLLLAYWAGAVGKVAEGSHLPIHWMLGVLVLFVYWAWWTVFYTSPNSP